MHNLTCTVCSTTFTGPKNKLYCAKPCAIKANTIRRSKTVRVKKPHVKGPCAGCGIPLFMGNKTQRYCTALCARQTNIKGLIDMHRGVGGRKGKIMVPYVRPREWHGHKLPGTTWTQGACNHCGEQFTRRSLIARYCTDTCSKRAKWNRLYKDRGDFSPTPRARHTIYARDNWTCQLCFTPIDTSVHYQHPMSGTLDHIIPQSYGLKPEHTPTNLRTTHRQCNSERGNNLDWKHEAAA